MKTYVAPWDWHNTKIKVYPDGQNTITYADHSIFHHPDAAQIIETETDTDRNEPDETEPAPTEPEKPDRERTDILKRVKDRVFDITYCNPWAYFLTVTFDPKETDSKDPQQVMEKLNKWLDNRVQRDDLQYLLIPEYHKKGGIHCHALINDTLRLSDSGTVTVDGIKKPMRREKALKLGLPETKLHTVYNVPQWKYGFSTAIPTYGEPAALAVYMTKYVTKDLQKIFGRYYWSSRNITREPDTIYTDTDFESAEGSVYRIDATGVRLKYESNITFIKR